MVFVMGQSELKLKRKFCKYQNIVMNDYGINLSELPTEVLLVCNAGLVNGLNQEIIFETFCNFGQIENVIMITDKSYCFIVFKDLIFAHKAFNTLNNKYLWQSIKRPIYLAFAEKLPACLKTTINFDEKPPGLYLIEDFITKDEENDILKCLESYCADIERCKSSELKNRKVYHFGYEFIYSKSNVNVNEPIQNIPRELDFIWDKLQKKSLEHCFEINFKPDQLTINNYQPGQGIPHHVDTHSAFEDPILSLSLQSSTIMVFKNSEGKSYPVLLPARSMCIISGESRYGWTHGIASRKSDVLPASDGSLKLEYRKERTSLTFRKIKGGKCTCDFPYFCDSQLDEGPSKKPLNALDADDASKLEENYVHEVYRKISDHFSETRHKPWPNVVKFVQSLPTGSILVDVGCGNGKYFNKNSGNFEIGLDASHNLLGKCREHGFECFTSNCLNIPLRSNVADGCISIAVIHHLVTEERRKRAIREIIRILKPNGKALIYVWAKNQERLNKKSCYIKKNQRKSEGAIEKEKHLDISGDLRLPVHTNRTNFEHNDLLVPWKMKDKTLKENTMPIYFRYYHVFEDDELKKLCSNLENIEIIDYYYDEGNWCILLQKTSN